MISNDNNLKIDFSTIVIITSGENQSQRFNRLSFKHYNF